MPDDGTITPSANPVLIELTRGDMVESGHRGAAAVVGADQRIVAAWGDIARPVYPRSAVKPLQALALIETGAADAFAVRGAEIALACASHNGERTHVEAVAAWLGRMGLGESDLECGPHAPLGPAARVGLLRADAPFGRLHNNCSGKHAAMLATARHMGEPTAGYIQPDHPVQRRVRALQVEMGGAGLVGAPSGADGCGIPTLGLPLAALARAMARLAAPDGLAPARAAAARRVVAAMTAHPHMVAGRDRFCTRVLAAGGGTVLVKMGAEGVYTAALPGAGLGIALKIDDGAVRAAEAAIAVLLQRFGALEGQVRAVLAGYAHVVQHNWGGTETGVLRPAEGWPG
jgi:L-asparaginase II